MAETGSWTVGRYLAARLTQVGINDYFVVPGDYNLVLLDEFLSDERLRMISCCNELNAGYAADGYARATGGPAAIVVTYSVGGLSALNAVAGAYAESLPLIAISGGPNTNSTAEYELLHHTLGRVDYDYQREIFARVTATAVSIQHPSEAPRQIDKALQIALTERRPVYLEVACNIASATVSAPNPIVFCERPPSDPRALDAAVEHAARLLDGAIKPVLVAGARLRSAGATGAFARLAEASGYAVASMPDAKGLFSEQDPAYTGIYWGAVGSPGCGEIVESSDLCVFAGGMFTDYTTVGHSTLVTPSKMIQARTDDVLICGETYSQVRMADFLERLSSRVSHNDASLKAFARVREEPAPSPQPEPDAALTTRALFDRIQSILGSESTVIAETGDSWFNGVDLDLPEGARFEVQMQYGSIGWSVGATLGYCVGAPERRIVALIGDGSFQLTAQEISTMIRYGVRPIIFLMNNRGYTIEVEIHDGPYNNIKNWDYAALVAAFNADDGNGWSARADTTAELDAAIENALAHDGPSLIEVTIDRDDCSKHLLTWGGHVARNNGRPPRSKG